MKNSPMDDYAWEKELAPKVSGRYVAFVAVLFGAWMVLMGAIAIHRWFGSLQ